MSAGAWPTVDELKLIVDVDPNSSTFDETLARQMAAAIELVKSIVGTWDDVIDVPDDGHAGAALRAAYLLSLKESPTAIVNDEVFRSYLVGKRRRFGIA